MYRAIVVIVAFAVLVPSASAKTDYVIVRDASIGGFPRNGLVAKAIEVFGTPAERQIDGDNCRLSWGAHGVVMDTYYLNFGNEGPNPCGPQGRHKSTTVSDERWRTSKGLEIGDPLSKLRTMYPRAQKESPSAWRLTTRRSFGISFPSLEARVRRGRVASFIIYGPRTLG